MSTVIQRTDVALRSFYIFNSQFGKKEGDEHKKVLYYYPSDIELNTKIKDVGLSEAIIAFTGTFTSDNECKALHTQKTTQIFHQAEPGYWMVLAINVPKEIRMKDGIEVADYRGSEVHDRIYRAVLQQAYNMFRLFEGTFEMNFAASGSQGDAAHAQLQQRLSAFFDKYLLTLKLSSSDMMDIMRSIQYLPLNKFLFLRAHNLINMTCSTFPAIQETIFFYNEHVVCSGKLLPSDLYSLHEHIKTKQTENSSATERFLKGAFVIVGESVEQTKVYLQRVGNTLHAYQLITYRALNITLCLFIDAEESLQKDFYAELHSYMNAQLIALSNDIGDTITKHSGGKSNANSTSTSVVVMNTEADASVPKYLFINEHSLKHLTNINIDRRLPRVAQSIPQNVVNLIADLSELNDDKDLASSAFAEVQIKTTNDFWIVKRRCNWRQYYVVIFNSKATLLDITHEAKRVFEQEITDDVFFDK